MGAALAWAPYVLTAAKTVTDNYAAQELAQKQNDELSRQVMQQASRQGEADKAIADTLAQQQASSADQDVQKSTADYLSQVRATQQKATEGLGQVGATSDAYQQSANNAALGVGDYANNVASLMARIDAPTQQRQRESTMAQNLASQLGTIQRKASVDDYISKLRLAGIKPNQWLQAASGVLGGAAAASSGIGAADAGLYGADSATTAMQGTNQQLYNRLQQNWGYT